MGEESGVNEMMDTPVEAARGKTAALELFQYEQALGVIAKAKELLSDRTKWTTGAIARDADGHSVNANSKKVVCWCSLGAVAHVADALNAGRGYLIANRAIDRLVGAAYLLYDRESIAEVNDLLGYDAAMKLFDYALTETY